MACETSGSEGWGSTGVAGVCDDHTDGDLDSIFSNWQYLAAVAWRGYQTLGCGTVVVSVSDEIADVSYAGGALPENYTRLVERYDPFEQLVIVVRHSTGEHLYLLSGQPSPPECAGSRDVRAMNANVYVPCGNTVQ
jgi:hypothetical protein